MRFVIITAILFAIATAIVVQSHERQLSRAYGTRETRWSSR